LKVRTFAFTTPLMKELSVAKARVKEIAIPAVAAMELKAETLITKQIVHEVKI